MSYLVDSDILIDALNGRKDAIHLLDSHSNEHLGISIISLGELLDGAVGATNSEQQLFNTQGFLAPYPVIQLNAAIMLQFARLRVALRRSGQPIPDFDLLIASTALVHNLTIMTRNRRHFERIPDIRFHDE